MTLIAAMKGHGCLFLAADSHVLDDGFSMTVQKLEFLDDPPLAWGFAGDEGVGRAFGRRLRALGSRLPRDWELLRDGAADELSRLNGRRKELAQQARAGHQPPLATVLLAGYLSGVPNVLELDASGGWYFIEEHEFKAIGDGRTHARVVFATLTRGHAELPRDAALMTEIMEMAATFAEGCAPPIRLLTITPERVQHVSREV